MAYTKTVWTDRDVEHPNRYKDQNNNQLILTRDEGTVTEAGTFLNSTVMNNIEDGIETLDTAVSDLDTAVSEKVNTSDIVDNLTSTSTTVPLSANMGKTLAGGTLKSKIIIITRDGLGANGDVSYTGIGFKPTSVKALMTVQGTLYKSNGFADSTGTSHCHYTSAANVERMTDWLITYSNQTAWVQHGKVKTYDNDGLTLTWEKIGTPSAGTMDICLLCER